MGGHLTLQDLDAALHDDLSPQRAAHLFSHFLRGCSICLSLIQQDFRAQQILGLAGPEEDAYDRAIDFASWSVAQETGIELGREERRRRASSLLASDGGLLALAWGAWGMPVEGLAVYEALLERIWEIRYEDPRERIRLTRAAVEVAGGLNSRDFEPPALADLRARAWGELANALRAADQLREAEWAFGTAFKLLGEGTGDRRLRARLLDFHGSFLGTQRDFEHALEALEVVHELHLETGDRHLAGRTRIKTAIYTHYSGRSEEALAILREAEDLLDLEREPGVITVVLFNRLIFLVACGRYREAKRQIFDYRARCQGHSRMMALKLRWEEGRISYGLGELVSAEMAFQEAKQEFEKVGMGFHAALASLDLATVWLRQGRTEEAEALTTEAAGLFQALDIHREVLGAVLLLGEAFRLKRATVGLAERTADFIRQWQNNPDIPYVLRLD